jgi:hypothetical protein
MRPLSNAMRLTASAILMAALGGCSEYTDRRDTIAPSSGNAVAADKVTHMVDPWPPASGNRNVVYNGAVMQNAYQRYRTGQVIAPNGTGTSATYQGVPQQNTTPLGPTVTQSAAPVK